MVTELEKLLHSQDETGHGGLSEVGLTCVSTDDLFKLDKVVQVRCGPSCGSSS